MFLGIGVVLAQGPHIGPPPDEGGDCTAITFDPYWSLPVDDGSLRLELHASDCTILHLNVTAHEFDGSEEVHGFEFSIEYQNTHYDYTGAVWGDWLTDLNPCAPFTVINNEVGSGSTNRVAVLGWRSFDLEACLPRNLRMYGDNRVVRLTFTKTGCGADLPFDFAVSPAPLQCKRWYADQSTEERTSYPAVCEDMGGDSDAACP